jgi:hypothetical protein
MTALWLRSYLHWRELNILLKMFNVVDLRNRELTIDSRNQTCGKNVAILTFNSEPTVDGTHDKLWYLVTCASI